MQHPNMPVALNDIVWDLRLEFGSILEIVHFHVFADVNFKQGFQVCLQLFVMIEDLLQLPVVMVGGLIQVHYRLYSIGLGYPLVDRNELPQCSSFSFVH